MRIVCQHVHSELLSDFLLEIDLSLISLEVTVDDDTVLVDSRETDIVAVTCLLASSRKGDGIILGKGSAVESILPVIVRNVFVVFNAVARDSGRLIFIRRLEIGIGITTLPVDFCLQAHELISIHQFNLVGNLVHRPGSRKIDFRLSFHTLLGSNHNDAIGSTCSVNSCC